MDSKSFKKEFGTIAKFYGFSSAYGGYFKQSLDDIIVLNLQKSNYGNYFYLNIKIYIQGVFNRQYTPSKDLIKKDIGHIFLRSPVKYDCVYDLEKDMDIEDRIQILNELFNEFLVPFTNKALSISGVKNMIENGEVRIFPAIREELKM